MSWWKKFITVLTTYQSSKDESKEEEEYETVRTRNKKGRYVADDPDTPENEAYTRTKKPTKKVTKKTIKKK